MAAFPRPGPRRRRVQLAVFCSYLAQACGSVVRQWLSEIPAYVFSCEAGARESEVAISKAACDFLQCNPGEILFVDDKPPNTINGPTAFGMKAMLIRREVGETRDGLLNAEKLRRVGIKTFEHHTTRPWLLAYDVRFHTKAPNRQAAWRRSPVPGRRRHRCTFRRIGSS